MLQSVLIFFLSFIFQLGMFSNQRCSEDVLLERRENVTGREFCFSPWTYFSCPTTVVETETVTETESVRDCCQDIQAHCQDNNLLYLLVILPLITLVILTLVLVFCVCKMKAKLKILRESRTRKPSQNTETSETERRETHNKDYQTNTETQTVNNPLYHYENSGFCTISEKILNQDSSIKIALHKGKL